MANKGWLSQTPLIGERMARRYGKAALFTIVPILVIVSLLAALVGPVRLGDTIGRLSRLTQARAGNLATANGPARDVRFGIAEGHKNQASKEIGIGWQRQTVPWDQIQPNGPDEFRADFVFTPEMLQTELNSGVQVVGLLQFTPGWAQSNPADGGRAIPKNLGLPYNDPNNYWGQFTRKVASHYAGRIDTWVIWNEPEIRPNDAGGGASWTWAGGPDEYAQLLKVAYLNMKEANPNAKIVFAGTAYWLDKNSGREQFFKRTLDSLAADPSSPANNWYMDAVGFNIYRAPDDIYRVAFEMKSTMQAKGMDKPLWLTETNAMPFDPAVPCADRFASNPSNVSLDTQASYAIQSMALGMAAGWERLEFYQMTDSGTCNESSIWGLARDDGSMRPAFQSYKTAVEWLSGAQSVTFAPYERETQAWGAPWPDNPASYYPNWQVYQVVAQRGDQRVSVIWNGDGASVRARIPKVGGSAVLIDKNGNQQAISETGGWYVVDLAPAATKGPFDPEGYYYIGGDPIIIVQFGVDPATPVSGPGLGDPGSQVREFKVFVSPENGQKVAPGQVAQFTLDVRGYEGFNDDVTISLKEYSTQRDPAPVSSLPGSLTLNVAGTVHPGDSVSVQVQTGGDIAPGIHFVTLNLDGGGITRTVDLVVQID